MTNTLKLAIGAFAAGVLFLGYKALDNSVRRGETQTTEGKTTQSESRHMETTRAKIQSALQKLGQDNLLAWADQFPRLGTVSLAKKLDAGVPPMSVVGAMKEEAHQTGRFADFARAALVRELAEAFPNGYGQSSRQNYGISSARALWLYIFDADQKVESKEIWERVEDLMRRDPAWTPADKNDPELLRIFAEIDLTRSTSSEAFSRVCETIRGTVERLQSGDGYWERAIAALNELPRGHILTQCMIWVNGEVNNGGFDQLYGNFNGLPVPYAIEGFQAIQRQDLADIVAESLAHGVRARRKLIHPSLLESSTGSVSKTRSWERLDHAYYDANKEKPTLWLELAIGELVESRPELFE